MSFVYTCPDCGAVMVDAGDGVLDCPSCNMSIDIDDYDDYVNKTGAFEEECWEEDDMPECCRACGGPYPSCMTSCKIFDD